MSDIPDEVLVAAREVIALDEKREPFRNDKFHPVPHRNYEQVAIRLAPILARHILSQHQEAPASRVTAAEARGAELEKALQAADGIALQVESMVKIGPSHDGSVERDLRRLLDVYRGMRAALAKPAHDALAKHPSPNQDILPTDPYGGT